MPDPLAKAEQRYARECRNRIYPDPSARTDAFQRGVAFGLHEAAVMIEDMVWSAELRNDEPPAVRKMLRRIADMVARGDWYPTENRDA